MWTGTSTALVAAVVSVFVAACSATAGPSLTGAPVAPGVPAAVLRIESPIEPNFAPLLSPGDERPDSPDAGGGETDTPGAPAANVADPALSQLLDDEAEALWLGPSQWQLPVPMRPLSQLSPDAARFLADRSGWVTAGVFVARDNAVYVSSPEIALPMASVAKVVIMLAVLNRAESEGRALTDWELVQLEPMLVWSDNDAATALWDDLGGAPAIEAYLERYGLRGIVTHPYAWGDSRASGPALAWLLGRLAFGDLVSPVHRDLAVGLLEQAALAQPWGVAPLGAGRDPRAVVGAKDGWYPVDAGWRAGSAGVVFSAIDGAPGGTSYSIAVLTAQNLILDDGIETIDGFASRIHAALAPR